MSEIYRIRPKADKDLDEQAYDLSLHGTFELGHRFLVAAHKAFLVLAHQPEIGWRPRLSVPELQSLRVFTIAGFDKMLVLYRPTTIGIEILRVVHGSRNLVSLFAREGVE